MTNEEAIEYLELEIGYLLETNGGTCKEIEADKVALTALREQAERDKGCEICNGKLPCDNGCDGFCDICNVPSVPAGEFRLNGLQTNADRIRAMSDEELAKFITYSDFCETICGCDFVCGGGCEGVMLDWLKQEADNPELGGDT